MRRYAHLISALAASKDPRACREACSKWSGGQWGREGHGCRGILYAAL